MLQEQRRDRKEGHMGKWEENEMEWLILNVFFYHSIEFFLSYHVISFTTYKGDLKTTQDRDI